MNRFGINLWNWCAGLSDDCLGKPTRAAELGFTAVELPMTVPTVSPALADEIRSTGLAVPFAPRWGREETFPVRTAPSEALPWRT